MLVDGLLIPSRLVALLDAGLWPRNSAEAMRHNLHSLIPKERIHRFAPEEDAIYLFAPPFTTVARRANGSEMQFWTAFGALDELDPELTLVIADFGLGSDAPLVLNYRHDPLCPSVLRLSWLVGQGRKTRWMMCADSFDGFAQLLGLL